MLSSYSGQWLYALRVCQSCQSRIPIAVHHHLLWSSPSLSIRWDPTREGSPPTWRIQTMERIELPAQLSAAYITQLVISGKIMDKKWVQPLSLEIWLKSKKRYSFTDNTADDKYHSLKEMQKNQITLVSHSIHSIIQSASVCKLCLARQSQADALPGRMAWNMNWNDDTFFISSNFSSFSILIPRIQYERGGDQV